MSNFLQASWSKAELKWHISVRWQHSGRCICRLVCLHCTADVHAPRRCKRQWWELAGWRACWSWLPTRPACSWLLIICRLPSSSTPASSGASTTAPVPASCCTSPARSITTIRQARASQFPPLYGIQQCRLARRNAVQSMDACANAQTAGGMYVLVMQSSRPGWAQQHVKHHVYAETWLLHMRAVSCGSAGAGSQDDAAQSPAPVSRQSHSALRRRSRPAGRQTLQSSLSSRA